MGVEKHCDMATVAHGKGAVYVRVQVENGRYAKH
jgi:hypothetical protein